MIISNDEEPPYLCHSTTCVDYANYVLSSSHILFVKKTTFQNYKTRSILQGFDIYKQCKIVLIWIQALVYE